MEHNTNTFTTRAAMPDRNNTLVVHDSTASQQSKPEIIFEQNRARETWESLFFFQKDSTPSKWKPSEPMPQLCLLKKAGQTINHFYIPEIEHSRLDKIVYFLPINLPKGIIFDKVVQETTIRGISYFSFVVQEKHLVTAHLISQPIANIHITSVRKPQRGFTDPNWISFTFEFPDGQSTASINLVLKLSIYQGLTIDSPRLWNQKSNPLSMKAWRIKNNFRINTNIPSHLPSPIHKPPSLEASKSSPVDIPLDLIKVPSEDRQAKRQRTNEILDQRATKKQRLEVQPSHVVNLTLVDEPVDTSEYDIILDKTEDIPILRDEDYTLIITKPSITLPTYDLNSLTQCKPIREDKRQLEIKPTFEANGSFRFLFKDDCRDYLINLFYQEETKDFKVLCTHGIDVNPTKTRLYTFELNHTGTLHLKHGKTITMEISKINRTPKESDIEGGEEHVCQLEKKKDDNESDTDTKSV